MSTNELRHGTWWDRLRGIPLQETMEGRFTRLFPARPNQPYTVDDLRSLATAMTASLDAPPTPETADPPDAEENSAIPAAYTYFGQFIDHDLTLDPTSSLRTRLSLEKLRQLADFRTPRFDLDCLYGRGPEDQPYLYDGVKMLLGDPMSGNDRDPHAVDVPRGPNGRALIGDPRNDENRIISQLQATMLRFHNAVVDAMPDADFATIRQQVRWHYQWVVVNDFLPTVVNETTVQAVLPHLAAGTTVAATPPVPGLLDADGLGLMPVEFSVAAYRFGHSMIRPIYRLNVSLSRRPIFSISTDPAGDLGGMRPIPSDWAIDWQFFLDIGDHAPGRPTPGDRPDPAQTTAFLQDRYVAGEPARLPACRDCHQPVRARRTQLIARPDLRAADGAAGGPRTGGTSARRRADQDRESH